MIYVNCARNFATPQQGTARPLKATHIINFILVHKDSRGVTSVVNQSLIK